MGSLSPEAEKAIADTQQLVLDGLAQESQPASPPAWSDAVRRVAETPDELLAACLGDTGMRLKRFAVRVNPGHPDLDAFSGLDAELPDGTKHRALKLMFQAAAAVVVKATAARAGGGEVEKEEELLLDPSWAGALLRILSLPRTRLLVGQQDRSEQRGFKKKVGQVGLKAALENGEGDYFGRPADFRRFARYSKHYLEEMRQFDEKQAAFLRCGMKEMSAVFGRRMRSLGESVADTCGFFRIRPDEASVTLARLHGFRWNDGHITVSSRNFEAPFWSDTPLEVVSDAETQKRLLVLNTKVSPSGAFTNFQYQPRMYPLAHFQATLPETAASIIDRVERMPLLNDAPFFDYFWALVPGINVNHPAIRKSKDRWFIKDGTDNLSFDDAGKAASELDALLVRQGSLVPAVIGERDGKCFFLCMWA